LHKSDHKFTSLKSGESTHPSRKTSSTPFFFGDYALFTHCSSPNQAQAHTKAPNHKVIFLHFLPTPCTPTLLPQKPLPLISIPRIEPHQALRALPCIKKSKAPIRQMQGNRTHVPVIARHAKPDRSKVGCVKEIKCIVRRKTGKKHPSRVMCEEKTERW